MLNPSKSLVIGGCILFLTGCGSTDSDNATAETARTTLGTSNVPLRAGLYRVVQTGDVHHQEERCIDAADVAAKRFAVPGTMGDGWTFDANHMAGGTIKVAARHSSGSRLNIDGTFQKESFDVAGIMEMQLNGETQVIRTRQVGTFASSTCPADPG